MRATPVDHTFNSSFPCGIKINALDIGKNIEAARIAPEAGRLTCSARRMCGCE
jgi:hypothetical protein